LPIEAPLFILDAGPNSLTGTDPATAFPEVPSNGVHTLQFAWWNDHRRTHPAPKQALPRVDAYNVTVQQQLTNSISLEVAYVGSKGTHGSPQQPELQCESGFHGAVWYGVDQKLTPASV